MSDAEVDKTKKFTDLEAIVKRLAGVRIKIRTPATPCVKIEMPKRQKMSAAMAAEMEVKEEVRRKIAQKRGRLSAMQQKLQVQVLDGNAGRKVRKMKKKVTRKVVKEEEIEKKMMERELERKEVAAILRLQAAELGPRRVAHRFNRQADRPPQFCWTVQH